VTGKGFKYTISRLDKVAPPYKSRDATKATAELQEATPSAKQPETSQSELNGKAGARHQTAGGVRLEKAIPKDPKIPIQVEPSPSKQAVMRTVVHDMEKKMKDVARRVGSFSKVSARDDHNLIYMRKRLARRNKADKDPEPISAMKIDNAKPDLHHEEEIRKHKRQNEEKPVMVNATTNTARAKPKGRSARGTTHRSEAGGKRVRLLKVSDKVRKVKHTESAKVKYTKSAMVIFTKPAQVRLVKSAISRLRRMAADDPRIASRLPGLTGVTDETEGLIRVRGTDIRIPVSANNFKSVFYHDDNKREEEAISGLMEHLETVGWEQAYKLALDNGPQAPRPPDDNQQDLRNVVSDGEAGGVYTSDGDRAEKTIIDRVEPFTNAGKEGSNKVGVISAEEFFASVDKPSTNAGKERSNKVGVVSAEDFFASVDISMDRVEPSTNAGKEGSNKVGVVSAEDFFASVDESVPKRFSRRQQRRASEKRNKSKPDKKLSKTAPGDDLPATDTDDVQETPKATGVISADEFLTSLETKVRFELHDFDPGIKYIYRDDSGDDLPATDDAPGTPKTTGVISADDFSRSLKKVPFEMRDFDDGVKK